MSVSPVSPETLFGGTWVVWGTGRVPVAIDSSKTEFNTIEKTGGTINNTYTPTGSNAGTAITKDQMPTHDHTVDITSGSTNINHSHKYTVTNGCDKTTITYGSGSSSRAVVTAINTTGASTGTQTTKIEHTHSVSGNTGSNGSGNAHTHTFTGNSASISALQPYIICYMWKRTK